MLIRNNKVLTVHSKWLNHTYDPYNPLNLPPFTIRVKYKQGTSPLPGIPSAISTLVDADNNIWDITCESTNWDSLFSIQINLLEVLGANTTGVTDMTHMFYLCRSLTNVTLFDTSSVTDMWRMFYGCTQLTSVPLYDTALVTNMRQMFDSCYVLNAVPSFDISNVTNMTRMLYNCVNAAGALELYNKSAYKDIQVSNHSDAFYNCGTNTVNGASELSQIPNSWGGTLNGIVLPAGHLLARYAAGTTPSAYAIVQTNAANNIWEISGGTKWNNLFVNEHSNLLEIIAANSTGVTQMGQTFKNCDALISVPLFDTSSVTTMWGAFYGCHSLESIPLFDTSNCSSLREAFEYCSSITTVPLLNTSNCTDMYRTFSNCYKVESGALALYQQASSQTTPPQYHADAFHNCGNSTTTGQDELHQIPSSWGGWGI